MIYVDMERIKIDGEIRDIMVEYTALTSSLHDLLADNFDENAADILFVMMGRVAMTDGELTQDDVFSMLEEALRNEKI